MSDLFSVLSQQLSGNAVGEISQRTGLEASTVSSVTAAALPLLLGALARNASSEQGAASLAGALERDHDGSVLDDLGGFLGGGNASNIGGGILGHVLGARQESVAASLGQATGADAGSVMQILQMLAPIVMGAVGRSARQQSALDPASLAQMLGSGQAAASEQSPQGSQLLASLLDADRDGSIIDDLGNMAAKFLGGGATR